MLSVDEVLAIHDRVARDFADTDDPVGGAGVRDNGHLLESAVSRQFVGFGRDMKYGDPYANAATLTFGLCCNHPFHNGNKRTALVSMLAHLDKNGLTIFGVKQQEIYTMIKSVATHTLGVRPDPRKRRKTKYSRREADVEVAEITGWLETKARKVRRGERQITYRQLRQILAQHGYTMQKQKSNKIGIYREKQVRKGVLRKQRPVMTHVHSINWPGDGRVVGMNAIKSIRHRLHLSEKDGCDAASFYEGADVIETFINEYRGVLSKLARE